MRPDSGNRWVTTITVIRGASNDTPATSESEWRRATDYVAARHGCRRCTGNAENTHARARRAWLARSSGWTACGRPAHRGRRLPGGAQLLDRVGTRRVTVVADGGGA